MRVSRAGAMLGSVAGWYVVFAALPLAIARRTRRIGWHSGRPSLSNKAGLIAVGSGSAGLIWCMISHYPPGQTVEVSLTPEFLVRSGPYGISRNPMYLCEEAIWLGWSVYFGSPSLVGFGLGLAAAMRYAVSREEKTLASRFGEAWAEYSTRVPRWIGRHKSKDPR
jgi:protein-S-isoprenylcysteine O-methyltransferase Ste14